MTFRLDHLVINVLFDMDRAAALMSQLGFTLTPRGFHSLGSINHLMVFESHYLELVGLPSGTEVLRRDVLESRAVSTDWYFRPAMSTPALASYVAAA